LLFPKRGAEEGVSLGGEEHRAGQRGVEEKNHQEREKGRIPLERAKQGSPKGKTTHRKPPSDTQNNNYASSGR